MVTLARVRQAPAARTPGAITTRSGTRHHRVLLFSSVKSVAPIDYIPSARTASLQVAREAPEMKALLGLAPEDRVMGFFTVGCIDPERRQGYRGSRGPWEDKVAWRN